MIVVIGDRAVELEPAPAEPEVLGPPRPTVADLIRYREERAAQGSWVPASGGTETPFRTRTGRTLLYCWQASTRRHAYLDVETDLILTDEEAREALATW